MSAKSQQHSEADTHQLLVDWYRLQTSSSDRADAWAKAISELEQVYSSEGALAQFAPLTDWLTQQAQAPKCECGSAAVAWQAGHHTWWCPASKAGLYD